LGIHEEIDRKKELILEREKVFANQIGSAVFEKPRISFWMILIPILFLHFIYRMQKYKHGRMKFDEDFMVTRRRVMDLAVEAAATGAEPDMDQVVRQAALSDELKSAYASWTRVLAQYYLDLLATDGDSFDSLVRSAYGSQTNYLLTLNRLGMAEREFYSAIKPRLAETEGAIAIIAAIEEQSHQLRRELAQRIFP
jgi:hypothetical protein